MRAQKPSPRFSGKTEVLVDKKDSKIGENMCSRYYIDPNMMEEISRVVQNIDGRIRLAQGDIRPTDVAPVIGQSEHGLELGMCRWGYPLSKGKNSVINALSLIHISEPTRH